MHLGIAYKLATNGPKDMKSLADNLAKGVMAIKILEEHARGKISRSPDLDQVEVYLAYPVMLKVKLDLPIDIEGMLYFRCSEVTQTDLDNAATDVADQLSDKPTLYNFLITNDKWLEALKQNFSKEYKGLEDVRSEGAESAEPDYEKIQAQFNQGLLELTEKALA